MPFCSLAHTTLVQPADHTSAQTDRTLGNLLPTSTKDETAPALSAPHVLTVVLTVLGGLISFAMASSLLAPGQQSLRNEYYALRHGWSKANEAGIIVSRIDSGARLEYGAVWEGASTRRAGSRLARRATRSKRSCRRDPLRSSRPISAAPSRPPNWSRPPSMQTSRPSRRCASGTSATSSWARTRPMKAVWEQDAIDASHTAWGVEAAAVVLERAAGAVQRVEGAREGHAVLLVSHGDCLPILQTAFAGAWTCLRTSVVAAPGDTCELRRLELSVWGGVVLCAASVKGFYGCAVRRAAKRVACGFFPFLQRQFRLFLSPGPYGSSWPGHRGRRDAAVSTRLQKEGRGRKLRRRLAAPLRLL